MSDTMENDKEKELICICCPNGCHLSVNLEEKTVKGNKCPRGAKYGISELTHPVRIVTTTIRIEGAKHNVLPVRTEKEIPKELMFEAIKEINKTTVKAPVKEGETIIENLLDTGVNVISSRSMDVL